jgi:hypothetical protein
MKTGPDTLRIAENVSGSENLKTVPDAVGTAENEFGRAKHENGSRRPRFRRKRVWELKKIKRDPTPSAPPKMSLGAQNMKTRPDDHGTADNESGSA